MTPFEEPDGGAIVTPRGTTVGYYRRKRDRPAAILRSARCVCRHSPWSKCRRLEEALAYTGGRSAA
jgi:hypothetical protein